MTAVEIAAAAAALEVLQKLWLEKKIAVVEIATAAEALEAAAASKVLQRW